jgi:hypothetical protein
MHSMALLAQMGSFQMQPEHLLTYVSLTTAISPWLYEVVAVGIIAFAIVKTWGGRIDTRKLGSS